jgi:hypothetical protein
MIPYEAPDTTIFMVSIAGYTKFFSMFTAPQTIHILTLVMELLDERMEQYNVFPVARMGQYLLVLSGSNIFSGFFSPNFGKVRYSSTISVFNTNLI